MSAFSWSYVYIGFFFLNTLSGGKSCLVAPGVAVPPWATETVLSPWMAADEARVSHVLPHVVWWKLYMICKHILLITFLNEPELFFYTQLNDFKYCFITVTI